MKHAGKFRRGERLFRAWQRRRDRWEREMGARRNGRALVARNPCPK